MSDKQIPNLNTPQFQQYSLEDWQAVAIKSLRGEALSSLSNTTLNGLLISPLYSDRPEATEKIPPSPLQRWDNRLAVLGNNAKAQNKSLLAGLSGGISSAQIRLDCPEIKSPINTHALPTVLKAVQLDIVPLSVMAGSQFTKAAEQIESIWSDQNINAATAVANFNADPVGSLAAAGELPTELDELLADMTQLAGRVHNTFPLAKTVCVNSTSYHNAGASVEQELTASLSTAALYMQSMLDAGMSPQSAHDAMTFQMACDADTLANLVKLRALKILWYHLAIQFGVAQASLQLVVETSQRMQSRNQHWINHLRNISAASAAAMGGAQSIIVHPHNRIDDNFVDDNIDLGNRVARNIAIILSEESAMTFVHDPMGGSYAIENLTNNLCSSAWLALQQLENDGGLVQALLNGHWQSQISAIQKQRVARLHNEADVQVGVNRYTTNKPHTDNHVERSLQSESSHANALRTIREAAEFEVV